MEVDWRCGTRQYRLSGGDAQAASTGRLGGWAMLLYRRGCALMLAAGAMVLAVPDAAPAAVLSIGPDLILGSGDTVSYSAEAGEVNRLVMSAADGSVVFADLG